MSARDELLDQFDLEDREDGKAVLDRYRAEVLRGAAEKLRTRAQQAPDPYGRYHSFKEVARVLIAELDPDIP